MTRRSTSRGIIYTAPPTAPATAETASDEGPVNTAVEADDVSTTEPAAADD